jgi:phosphate uptake regulator
MKRKVIKLAQQTLVVSLPASWCKQHHVKKGDELSFEPLPGKLLISTTESTGGAQTIDADAWGTMTKRVLTQAYQTGMDRITVHAKKPETLARVQDALASLLGYHIIEQKASAILIEDLTKPDQDLPVLMRRCLLLIKTMFDDGIRALQDHDTKRIANLWNQDLEVNKLASLCIRTMNKNHAKLDARLYAFIHQAEQLADELKLQLPKLNETHVPALKQALTVFDAAYQFFFDRTFEKAKNVSKAYDEARSLNLSEIDPILKKAVSLQELYLQDVRHPDGPS